MRFRYTTASGDEVEVRDLDALRDHVRSGRVVAETPLTDTITGHSGPASTHQAYRFIVDVADVDRTPGSAVEEGGAADATTVAPSDTGGDSAETAPAEPVADAFGAEDASGDEEGDDSGALPDLEVTLAEPGAPRTTEDFVARLERERADDANRSERSGDPPSIRVDPYNDTLRSWDDEEASEPGSQAGVEPEETRREVPDGSDERPGRDFAGPPSTDDRAVAADAAPEQPVEPAEAPSGSSSLFDTDRHRTGVRRSRRAVRSRRSDRRRMAGRLLRAAVMPAVIVAGAFVALRAWAAVPMGSAGEESAVAEVAEPSDAPLDPAGIADRLSSSHGIAFHHMVQGMDSLARVHGAARVPEVWLEGPYLADAAAHPEVARYWWSYLDFVEELRRSDASLFRKSFVARMQGLDVSPAVVALRVAQARQSFEESQPQRDTMYAGMERLARSSLALDRLLRERADDIHPVPGSGVTPVGDPFLQVHTEDEELQERIYELLDEIFAELEALHGETRWTRAALNTGVLESIRSTGGEVGGGGGDGGGEPEDGS